MRNPPGFSESRSERRRKPLVIMRKTLEHYESIEYPLLSHCFNIFRRITKGLRRLSERLSEKPEGFAHLSVRLSQTLNGFAHFWLYRSMVPWYGDVTAST